MKPIPLLQVEQNFNDATFARGLDYQKKGKVQSIEVSSNGERVRSTVLGRGGNVYYTDIFVENEKDLTFIIEGDCTCPVAYNCKHVVATMIEAELPRTMDEHFIKAKEQEQTEASLQDITTWLSSLDNVEPSAHQDDQKNYTNHLLYELSVKSINHEELIAVNLKSSKILKKGGYGAAKKWYPGHYGAYSCVQEPDNEIVPALMYLENQHDHFNAYVDAQYVLKGAHGEKWLKKILATGRAFWLKAPKTQLSLAAEKELSFKWQLKENGNQMLVPSLGDESVTLFKLSNYWYINHGNGTCGPVESALSGNQIEAFLKAPEIPPEHSSMLMTQLKKLNGKTYASWLPRKLNTPLLKENIKPIPVLSLEAESVNNRYGDKRDEYYHGFLRLYFDYDGQRVPFSFENTASTITYLENDTPCRIERDFDFEKDSLRSLGETLILESLNEPSHKETADRWLLFDLEAGEDFVEFSLETIPQLEALGFTILRNHPLYLEVLSEEEVSWYSDLDEQSEHEYFNFSLGIEVSGEKINILPLIASLLGSMTTRQLEAKSDEEKISLPLPNSKILTVPFARIRPILNILIELYDAQPNNFDGVQLSRTHAALLHEIQEAFKASNMRLYGGKKLKTLGKELANFKGIKEVKLPKLFAATLREYQQQGANWLQFLRQYQLGGVLADDMGLGKTVQTLAHLCIEKNRGRMKKPSLIVAPTSLMVNWNQEANRFAPNLKVLIYHGEDRHLYRNDFQQYNLVLTTYALLSRDKELLLKQEFYYLILDEAQYIKNTKAKGTQIIHQIRSDHRLCLTGTPMENHLGELWSLFHFLMPGFLGNEKQFKQFFRTPIEKNKDLEKQKMLAARVKPFMLRRLKDEVVLDLPPKTEIIRTVELSSEQKDLYESIRLSMEKKVREAINKKGLSRSHIILLDALLKLRQTCCHPQLLSLNSARKNYKHSAKFNLLMDMLPQMIEEGRKVLVFSQFTKMLSLIEQGLTERGINFVKLTGATRNREKPVNSFQSGEVPVFLISLKAGGTGLNLTAADSVIHFDPWWNPAVEDQASDRSHRIGQDKPVFVYKIITKGTIEETIQEMQQKKRALMNGLFNEQEGRRINLSADDLQSLFKPIG